ncbi:alpha/beta fold hydrolase [Streptomyces sp. YC537]|uniref:Alpha/beta fold hydrolase n=2 Tax=Streptomyces boluensis TaxID=1775135 RepID=A0A964UN48_9ACTN|nr:alpha/beta fold hydrolase [Streptomyces boluensis]
MTWLQRMSPRPEAEQRLVCFPHAGGTAAFYAPWDRLCSRSEVHAVCYPGRARRAHEPFATDLRRMAHDIARDIARATRPLTDRPLVFFGHSMGAWVAFEAARYLEHVGVAVSHLFVSGARGPHTRKGTLTQAALRDDAAIVEEIVALGGVHPELLAEPALLKRVFPYVVADIHMADSYAHRPGPPLHCPITALAAADDPIAAPHDVASWARQTRGAFRAHKVPGDHFYLDAEPPVALVEAHHAATAEPAHT